jgi:hypothetical protein
MAITIDAVTNGDYVILDALDATTNITLDEVQFTMIATNNDVQAQGTACIQTRSQAGIGSITANFGSVSLENTHLRMWSRLAQDISLAYGGRLIIGLEADHGSWQIYNETLQVTFYNGWMMFVADPRKPFDETVGTQPTDILAITDAGLRQEMLFVNISGPTGDCLFHGTELSVEGGTTGDRGTFAEWAAEDRTDGWGSFADNAGVYFTCTGAVFQADGTDDSYFEDLNQIIIFSDLPVAGSLYKWRHVGNSTGTNHFQLGLTAGSGVDQEGSDGGTIVATGAAPFRIEAIDSDVDAVNYYGVTMLGPDALYDNPLRNVKHEDNSGASFTDISSDATGPDLAIVELMPATEAVDDATYFGADEIFYNLGLDLSTGKAGTWTGIWEYWDGSAWSALTDVTDDTDNFATTGAQTVDWSIPDDWATTAIDSDTRYWVRFRIDSFTSSGAGPAHSVNGCTCAHAGDIKLEDANVDMVGCTLTGMGAVRVRNGAFLKKTTLNAAVTPVKHAALDLGGADPASDTVRDVTIANCNAGVLLKGSGDVTYNFRHLLFVGNTSDVRVDFGSGDTVTINILEFGDTPSIDNVNGSTIVINSGVTTLVNVKDHLGANLENARVLLEAADAAGDLPFEESVTITSSGTLATVAHTGHGIPDGKKVVIRGSDDTIYNGVFVISVNDANEYEYTMDSTPASGTATGTIIASGVHIEGLTDSSGNISDQRAITLDQPLVGVARKSTASPRFKSFPLAATCDNSTGSTTNIQMIIDE